MSVICIAVDCHWHWLFCHASGSACPSYGSSWPTRGASGGYQHTLIARGFSFSEGLRRGIIVHARVVIVAVWFQKISRAHCDMMFWVMMFCEIIGAVSRTAAPVDKVLSLPDSITNPIESHIHCFGAFLFHGFVGDTAGSAVVGDHRGRWLGMA